MSSCFHKDPAKQLNYSRPLQERPLDDKQPTIPSTGRRSTSLMAHDFSHHQRLTFNSCGPDVTVVDASPKQAENGDLPTPTLKTWNSRFMLSSSPWSSSTSNKSWKTGMATSCNVARPLSPRSQKYRSASVAKRVDSSVQKLRRDKVSSRGQHRMQSNMVLGDNGRKKGKQAKDSESDRETYDTWPRRDSPDISSSKMSLACPFYKHDSIRYMSCVRLRLTRVRDVKQHLNRRHRCPIHCPICGDTFDNKQMWETHIMARSCARPPSGFVMEGLTEAQSVALGRRVNRSLDEASQWFSIWHTVFPDSPLPPSPYLRNDVEETLCMIHDYWRSHGNELISELVESTPTAHNNSLGVAAFSSQVLETLLLRFRNSSSAVTDPASANPTAVGPITRAPIGSTSIPFTISSCLTDSMHFSRYPHDDERFALHHDSVIGISNSSDNLYNTINPVSLNSTLALSQDQVSSNPTSSDHSISSQGYSIHSIGSMHSGRPTHHNQGVNPINNFQHGLVSPSPYHRILSDYLDPSSGTNSQVWELATWFDIDISTHAHGDVRIEHQPPFDPRLEPSSIAYLSDTYPCLYSGLDD